MLLSHVMQTEVCNKNSLVRPHPVMVQVCPAKVEPEAKAIGRTLELYEKLWLTVTTEISLGNPLQEPQ